MATGNPFQAAIQPFQRAILPDGLGGIFRTTRNETAMLPQQRAYSIAVKAYQNQQKRFHHFLKRLFRAMCPTESAVHAFFPRALSERKVPVGVNFRHICIFPAVFQFLFLQLAGLKSPVLKPVSEPNRAGPDQLVSYENIHAPSAVSNFYLQNGAEIAWQPPRQVLPLLLRRGAGNVTGNARFLLPF